VSWLIFWSVHGCTARAVRRSTQTHWSTASITTPLSSSVTRPISHTATFPLTFASGESIFPSIRRVAVSVTSVRCLRSPA
jgi:hypothetical protein